MTGYKARSKEMDARDAEILRLLRVPTSYKNTASALGLTIGVVAGVARANGFKRGHPLCGSRPNRAKRHPWGGNAPVDPSPVVRVHSVGWEGQQVGTEPCAAPDGCTAKALRKYPYCAEHCSIFYVKGKGK